MFLSPHYGQFCLICPWGKKALTVSLNSTRLIQTPVNADNGRLFLAQSTNSHREPTLLMRTRHYQVGLQWRGKVVTSRFHGSKIFG